jgi:hypothetical protein
LAGPLATSLCQGSDENKQNRPAFSNTTKDVAILRQRQKTHNLPATPEEQD